ncbi:MAG: flagellar biosynthetic protein FliO [Thermoguttaceae bacterium]|jgi:flagellar biogenesis protein FliO
MKIRLPSRGILFSFSAAAVFGLILAALFSFAPAARSLGADETAPEEAEFLAEKTPITTLSPKQKEETRPKQSYFLDMAGKLLLVLAAVFVLFYSLRRFRSPNLGALVGEGALAAAAVLPLTTKNSLALVRFGRRLLLVSLSGDRTEKLAETSDATEIEEILASLNRKGKEK